MGVTIDIDLADIPYCSQFVPVLDRVDVIAGRVTGPVADQDAFTAPNTTVVTSFEVATGSGRTRFQLSFGRADEPF
ncbi:hypothetical protein [Salinispora arenicola]|uniref:Uncharacterized protein n=1 Tax=Salinispora arenicola TaxID=168697 RepID=A0ABQ4JWA2_SALAC|nr:hypothetical protein [Salinispora arenicola]MCN0155145.1 hypothetical protein [Salinispora arenicola]GIM87220.1 hypothetical protein Sar04_39560 [Salinispora arenicola]